jgi:hypothetical protein
MLNRTAPASQLSARPSASLRLVPLPICNEEDTPSQILPIEDGEGDRPAEPGGGGADATPTTNEPQPPLPRHPSHRQASSHRRKSREC